MEGKAYLLANATYDMGKMTRSPSSHGCSRGEYYGLWKEKHISWLMRLTTKGRWLEVSEVCGGKGISRNKCDSRPGADDTESQWSRLC